MAHPHEDSYAWTQETIKKLREGKLNEVDTDALIEELEQMASSDRNEIENRLVVLLAHLLKWRYQPERKSRSWHLTIEEQRYRISRKLKKCPSLKPLFQELVEEAYPSAVFSAARETDLDKNVFPATFDQTGWTWEQVLEADFFPGKNPEEP